MKKQILWIVALLGVITIACGKPETKKIVRISCKETKKGIVCKGLQTVDFCTYTALLINGKDCAKNGIKENGKFCIVCPANNKDCGMPIIWILKDGECKISRSLRETTVCTTCPKGVPIFAPAL